MVKIYSTSTCPYCEMAKDFLKNNNVEFEDVDVSEDHAAQEEMIKKSGQMGVPVIEIDGKMIIGFDRAAVEEALKGKSII